MAEFNIKVSGLVEVQKNLYSYSKKLGDKVVVDALKAGARVIQKDAKRRAPKRTGQLRKNIVLRKSKHITRRKTPGRIGVYVTIKTKGKKGTQKNAFYGRFINDGWKPRGNSRRVKGRHFMQRAFRNQRNNAVRLSVSTATRGANLLARKMRLS
ncbi:MAG: HK97 gp10 family phage protein [Candidatus Thiodiazotropha lotti]|nr:HK97 gp10 family phage protein [Candidatus Thiodiazotropha lotti]